MGKIGLLTKIASVIGSILTLFPILATIGASIAYFVGTGSIRVDYLMPAELGLFAFAGGMLLLWAAWRARSRRALIGWGVALAIASLVGGQAIAVASGLASGATQPSGLPWIVVMASLIAYTVAVAEVGVCGILLACDVFARGRTFRAARSV